MKLTPLVALSLAGCSLYFGDGPTYELTLGGPLPGKCGDPEVHVFGVYETRSDHSGGYHPTGEGHVSIERKGDHILVLSSYEPTDWKVSLASGANVLQVVLIGYEKQSVDLDVPVVHGNGYTCRFTGEGCETSDLLDLISQGGGTQVTSFHGCYRATEWTLHADGSVASSCDTAAGYEVIERYAGCGGGSDDGGMGDWGRLDFQTFSPAPCTGERYVRFDKRYGKWVGAVLCDARSYKLYMSESPEETFLEIADYAGHGQDHCELVNPEFTIPNEDDIKSGGCTACSVSDLIDINGAPVYARGVFGQPFERVTSRFWADLTTNRYSCGVSIP
jgi:hypothetical protein